MQSAGIQKISLNYSDGHFGDAYGNKFRYRAQIVPASASSAGPWIYDVVLLYAGKH